MVPGAIPKKELRLLPFPTLERLAMAIARDIDAGEEGKREILETVFEAIRRQT